MLRKTLAEVLRRAGGLDRWAVILTVGILTNLALSIYPLFFDGCQACKKGINVVALSGALFYAALFVVHMIGARRWVNQGIRLAALVHIQLIAYIVIAPLPFCAVCLAAAIIAVGLAAISLREEDRILIGLGRVLPVAIAVFAGLVVSRTGASAQPPPAANQSPQVVLITAYVADWCPHCQQFKKEVAPQILKEFGNRVQVKYLDGSKYAFVNSYPTITIERGSIHHKREGNPGLPAMRDMVLAALSGAPMPKEREPIPEPPKHDAGVEDVAASKFFDPSSWTAQQVIDAIEREDREEIKAIRMLSLGCWKDDIARSYLRRIIESTASSALRSRAILAAAITGCSEKGVHIGSIASPELVASVRGLIHDGDDDVRTAARDALRSHATEQGDLATKAQLATEIASQASTDNVEQIKLLVADIDYGSIDGERLLTRFVQESPDAKVRAWAAAEMARSPNPAFDTLLTQLLITSGDDSLKAEILKNMDHVKLDPKRTELLEAVVSNSSEALDLRVTAARRLAESDKDRRPQIRNFADQQLARLRSAPDLYADPVHAEVDLVLLKSLASQ